MQIFTACKLCDTLLNRVFHKLKEIGNNAGVASEDFTASGT